MLQTLQMTVKLVIENRMEKANLDLSPLIGILKRFYFGFVKGRFECFGYL